MTRARPGVRLAVCFALAVVVVLVVAWQGRASGSTVRVSVNGRDYSTPRGTRLSVLLASHDLAPRSGNLVSVTGRVLRAGVFAGHVLLNGHPGTGDPLLRTGDVITLQAGRDRRERGVRIRRRVAGGEPSAPMFTLSTTPGYEVIVKGRVSGEIGWRAFHPTGRPHTPDAVALTFDDGPSPLDTLKILHVLRRLHARATFFLIGRQAQAYPSIVKAELAAGMMVEDHSWDHPITPPFAQLSTEKISHEITWTKTVVDGEGGHVTLFRPPGGSTSPQLEQIAKHLSCQTVLWSVDPRDWAPDTTSNQITHRVLNAAKPGSIILLHDGGGTRDATLAALPRIIHRLRARGLKLVTLPT